MKTYELPKKLIAQSMRQAGDEIRKNHENGIFDEGDPNNPKYNNGYNYITGYILFGYAESEFLAKQYY